MKQSQLLLTLTTFCLLVTGISGYYTCNITKEGGRTIYRDEFTSYIEQQTTLIDVRRVANESLHNITLALAGWQDEVVGDVGPYLDKVDNAVEDFEDKYNKQYVQCPLYTMLMQYIYEQRRAIEDPIIRIFAHETKNKFKTVNTDNIEQLDRMIKKCNNEDKKKQDDCLKVESEVDYGKYLLKKSRRHFCFDVYVAVEEIDSVEMKWNEANDIIKRISVALDDKKRCENY